MCVFDRFFARRLPLILAFGVVWIADPPAALSSESATAAVEVGFGRVRITVNGGALSRKETEEIETEIVIDEQLALLVTDDNLVVVDIPFESAETKEELRRHIKDRLSTILQKKQDEGAFATAGPDDAFLESKMVFGDTYTVERGRHVGHVYVTGGLLIVHGTVDAITVFGGKVELKSTAVVADTLTVIGGTVEREEGAQVAHEQNAALGNWSFFIDEGILPWAGQGFVHWGLWAWFVWLGFLLTLGFLSGLAVLALTFGADFHTHVQGVLRASFFSALGWGALGILGLGPLLVFLLVSLVGWPLIPVVLTFAFLFLALGYVHVGWWLSEKVGRVVSPIAKWPALRQALFGLVLAVAASWFVPRAWIVIYVLVLAGYGALIQVLFNRFFTRRPAPASPHEA